MFEDDPTVLYVSLHRYGGGFYPGFSGAPSETGYGAGKGYNCNIGWRAPAGADASESPQYGDAEYIAAFERLIMPLAREFGPGLVIVSAGFDAAAGDPLGGMQVSPAGYAHMTHLLRGVAGGRVVVALEGGYNLRSIATSAAAVMAVLLGEAPPLLPPLRAAPRALKDIARTAARLAPHWRCLRDAVVVHGDAPAKGAPPAGAAPGPRRSVSDPVTAAERGAVRKPWPGRRPGAWWRRWPYL